MAERAITKRYEQPVRSEGPAQPFLASEAGKAFSPRFREQAAGYDERNPPLDDTIPDGPGEAARALNRRLHPMNDELPGDLGRPKVDTSERDGVPAFLDRRRATATPTIQPSRPTWTWWGGDHGDHPHHYRCHCRVRVRRAGWLFRGLPVR